MADYVNSNIFQLSNVEAEREVVAGCLSDDNIWQAVSPLLADDLFTDYESKKAYGIMRQMEREGKAMDYSEFGQRFASVHGQLGLFMMGSITSYELTRQRAELLRELSTKRKLYALCTKGMTIATDPTAGIEDFEKLLRTMVRSAMPSMEATET